MAEHVSEVERSIIILSFFILIILAIVMHFSADQTMSLFSVFLIILIALANIGYLFGRRRKTL